MELGGRHLSSPHMEPCPSPPVRPSLPTSVVLPGTQGCLPQNLPLPLLSASLWEAWEPPWTPPATTLTWPLPGSCHSFGSCRILSMSLVPPRLCKPEPFIKLSSPCLPSVSPP